MVKKIIILISFFLITNFIFSQNEVFLKTDTIKFTDIFDSIYYGGRIVPLNTIIQYSSINGIVENIYVKEGQRVARGTTVCSIRRKLSSESYQPAYVASVADGLVVNMKIFNQMEVFDKSELFSIADDSKYKVEILVSDKDILNVKLNDECYIKENNINKNDKKENQKNENDKKTGEIKGYVSNIAVLPGDNKGLFRVEINFDKSQNLFIGKFVTMELRINKRNAIIVLQTSILKKYGKVFIFIVLPDSTIKLREIITGQNIGESVEIKGGVNPNELYIVNPTSGLIEGDKVNIKK